MSIFVLQAQKLFCLHQSAVPTLELLNVDGLDAYLDRRGLHGLQIMGPGMEALFGQVKGCKWMCSLH